MSFSASSVRFELSVCCVSTAKFINVQSLSSQAQTVWCLELGKAFLISISVPGKNKIFKKVSLILALFTWSKGRCVALRSNTHRDNQSRLLTVYSCGCAWDYSQEWMAGTRSLTLFLCVCEWSREEEDWACVFLVCILKEKGLWLCSLSVRYIHREDWKLSHWKVVSPGFTQDLCRQRRRISCFLMHCLFLLRETHTNTCTQTYAFVLLHFWRPPLTRFPL